MLLFLLYLEDGRGPQEGEGIHPGGPQEMLRGANVCDLRASDRLRIHLSCN